MRRGGIMIGLRGAALAATASVALALPANAGQVEWPVGRVAEEGRRAVVTVAEFGDRTMGLPGKAVLGLGATMVVGSVTMIAVVATGAWTGARWMVTRL